MNLYTIAITVALAAVVLLALETARTKRTYLFMGFLIAATLLVAIWALEVPVNISSPTLIASSVIGATIGITGLITVLK